MMKNIFSSLAICFVVLMGVSSLSLGQTGDENTLLQIAQGDKLVTKKDLDIPANTERIYFGLKIDSGTINSGCALVVVPSNKSRRIVVGAELVFSGTSNYKKVLNQYKHTDYTYTAEMMTAEAVTAVECYGTTFESQFQDLYVKGMKNELKENFDFVPAEPEIIH